MGLEQNANNVGLSRRHITESIDGSLRRLHTNFVDLYQVRNSNCVLRLVRKVYCLALMVLVEVTIMIDKRDTVKILQSVCQDSDFDSASHGNNHDGQMQHCEDHI